VIRRGIALILALTPVTPPVQAGDISQPLLKLELGIRLSDSGKLDLSFNGIPLRAPEPRAHMTCPPPPQSCAPMIAVFSVALAGSVVLLYAVSRNH
jgi:hypothetical protein